MVHSHIRCVEIGWYGMGCAVVCVVMRCCVFFMYMNIYMYKNGGR